MRIEITDVTLDNGIVTIGAIDVSEENLQRMERNRNDNERYISFIFDTKQIVKKNYGSDRYTDRQYLDKWLHSQKATQGSKTWGEALNSILGTVTNISSRNLVLE